MFNVLHRSQPQLSTAADTSGHRLRLPLWNDTLLDTFGALKRESAVPAIENGGLYFRTWGIRTTRPPSVIDPSGDAAWYPFHSQDQSEQIEVASTKHVG